MLGRILFGLVLMVVLPLSVHSQTYWNLEPIWVKAEPESASSFGVTMASGDIDGDGKVDLGIGFARYINLGWWGRVWLFLNNGNLDTLPDIELKGRIDGDAYRRGLTFSDINDDGINDVIVGAPSWNSGKGIVYVYYGGAPFDTLPDIEFNGEQLYSTFGNTITSGDVNGDSVNDVIIGAYCTNYNDGRVYIYYGGSNIDTIPDIILNGEDNEASNFGYPVSSGFDVNNDGFDDVFIGAGAYSQIGFWRGRAYIYYGGDPMDTIPDVIMDGTRPGDFFGEILALTGDLNGDGFDDAVVGENLSATHDTVFVYFGGNPMDPIVDVVLSGKDGSRFGESIAGNLNVNSDSYYDLVVGAVSWEQSTQWDGRVYVFCGNDPFPSNPSAFATGDSLQRIGWNVASAGDIDGNGTDEIMFSNYAGYDSKVWVCKYTGTGIQVAKNPKQKIRDIRLVCNPNPFTTSTTVSPRGVSNYQSTGISELEIYDASGRFVRSLELNTSSYQLGADLTPGVYFLKFTIGEHSEIQKLIKIR